MIASGIAPNRYVFNALISNCRAAAASVSGYKVRQVSQLSLRREIHGGKATDQFCTETEDSNGTEAVLKRD